MKKIRRAWLVFVCLTLVVFIGYRIYEMIKKDSSGPVITIDKTRMEVSIYDEESLLLKGITASDKKDGDVTSSVIVENISNFYEDNVRMVTYAAFDSDNHISKEEREMVYTDYTSPRFELNGSLRFRAGESINIDKIVKAWDCLDGEISNKVKIRMETSINNRLTGFYRVDYVVTNSAGDTVTLPIDIEIYEPFNHEVELNLDRYLVYYTGEEIAYKDFLKSIRKGNLEYAFEGVELVETTAPETDETEGEAADTETAATEVTSKKISKNTVSVESLVDPSTPGVYPVYFYYTEDNGNYTSEAKEVLFVVVE